MLCRVALCRSEGSPNVEALLLWSREVLLVVQHRFWIIGIVLVVAIPLSYFLNRAVVAKFWVSRNDQGVPSRRSTATYVIGLWAIIALLVMISAIYPTLWWLWLILFLGCGYAAIAAIIVKRSRQGRS